MWDNAALLRKVANALIVFSVLATLYWAVNYTVHLPTLFPVRSLQLGAAPQRVDAEEVLEVARNEVRGNLFTVDIERLRESLEKLAWVRSVRIRREFPHSLTVYLDEHQAAARWNNGALVNQYGEVFVADSKQQILPEFIGQEGTAVEVMQHYTQFNQQLDVLGLSVAQIALSPRHAWQLRLSNGMVLELGRKEMSQRLAQFVTVYPYSLAIQKTGGAGRRAESAVAYVDLRYRNGFAVRRRTDVNG